MADRRLNEVQKEILKIYQETSERKNDRSFALSRQDIARVFFRRPKVRHTGLGLVTPEEKIKSPDTKSFPRMDVQREEWARKIRARGRFSGDWRARVGGKALRGIYSKKQEIISVALRDLVKQGYLERFGSGAGPNYRATEKTFGLKISRF